jgi:hypothetical protein
MYSTRQHHHVSMYPLMDNFHRRCYLVVIDKVGPPQWIIPSPVTVYVLLHKAICIKLEKGYIKLNARGHRRVQNLPVLLPDRDLVFDTMMR